MVYPMFERSSGGLVYYLLVNSTYYSTLSVDYKNSKRLNLAIKGALKFSIKLFMMENNLNNQAHFSL